MGIALLSTFLTTVSIFILKHSADVEKGRLPWRRYRFVGGLALNLFSEFLLFSFAMTLTPISLLAPLTGTGVVFSALIASSGIVPGVQEKLALSDWICTFLVLIGVSIAAIFGPGSNEASDLNALPSAMSNPGFLAFVSLAVGIITGWLAISKVKLLEKLRPEEKSLQFTLLSGLSASLCGSLCVVFTKVLMVAIRYLALGDNTPFRIWAVWVALISLAVLAPLQLYLLNSMLASGFVSLSVPMYLSLMVLLVAAGGGTISIYPLLTPHPSHSFSPLRNQVKDLNLYAPDSPSISFFLTSPQPRACLLFSEFQSLPPFETSMFALSVASVMCGLAVLSFRQQKKLMQLQLLEASRQLRDEYSQNINNSSGKSSGRSLSHRDERSIAVRETDAEVQAAVLASLQTSARVVASVHDSGCAFSLPLATQPCAGGPEVASAPPVTAPTVTPETIVTIVPLERVPSLQTQRTRASPMKGHSPLPAESDSAATSVPQRALQIEVMTAREEGDLSAGDGQGSVELEHEQHASFANYEASHVKQQQVEDLPIDTSHGASNHVSLRVPLEEDDEPDDPRLTL
ncbi:MAG: hypothetical protein SGPRY_010728 [Prymnesium sp.]